MTFMEQLSRGQHCAKYLAWIISHSSPQKGRASTLFYWWETGAEKGSVICLNSQRMGGDSSLKAHEFDTLVTTASLNQASCSLTHLLTDPHTPHAHSRPLIHPELTSVHLFMYLNADQASTPSRNFCHYLSFHGPSLSLPPLIRFIVGTTDLSIQFHTWLY